MTILSRFKRLFICVGFIFTLISFTFIHYSTWENAQQTLTTKVITPQPRSHQTRSPIPFKPKGKLPETPSLGPTPRTARNQAARLLFLLQRFALENIPHAILVQEGIISSSTASSSSLPHTLDSVPVMERNASFILNQYYETDLSRLNSRFETQLNEELPTEETRSKTYDSPIHSARRGYGMGGSIFVALVHNEPAIVSHDTPKGRGGCAETVHRMYSNARWPVALFTGIVEVVVASPNDALPPSACVPTPYVEHACMESQSFCPIDNIRVRQILLASGQTTETHTQTQPGEEKEKAHTRKGPLHSFSSIAAQRYAALMLYRGETYVMFVRDGLSFAPHWDSLSRLLLLHTPTRRGVLTQPSLRVQPDAIRSVWSSFVVAHVHGIRHALQQMRSTTNRTLTMAALGEWMHSVEWALDPNATELDPRANTDNEDTYGLHTDSVMQYIFREATKDKNRKDPKAEHSTSRAAIQLHWLRHFAEQLRHALGDVMNKGNHTTCMRGVNVPNGNEWYVTLQTTQVRRMSHAMQETAYMDPPNHLLCEDMEEVSKCPNIDFAALPPKRWGETNCTNCAQSRPFLLQPVATTEFLFTRAEAFFDHHHHYSSGNTKDALNEPDIVRLDPHLSLLTPDEESVLLSARLWTNGWDFFAPTEPIITRVDGGELSEQTDSSERNTRLSDKTRQMREYSVARMRYVLFDEIVEGLDEALVKKKMNYFGLGKKRSREDFIRFSGFHKTGEATSWCDSKE